MTMLKTNVFIMEKTHGRVTRVGKARMQTPKVCISDRIDIPNGQAHNRMLYNKRSISDAASDYSDKQGSNTHGGR